MVDGCFNPHLFRNPLAIVGEGGRREEEEEIIERLEQSKANPTVFWTICTIALWR